jgi:hypothetical protein
MKRTATFPWFAGILLALFCSNATGQVSVADTSAATLTASDNKAVRETEVADTAVVDSARLAQMAIQAELSREVAALSRTYLGSEQLTWTHVAHFNLERAGRGQKQAFWNNPKDADTPHLWQVINGPSDDVFYLDPEQGRAATINLHSLQGNFIPASIAAKAGFTGNQSQFLPKKSEAWNQVGSTDTTTVWTAATEGGSLRLTLRSEKDADQAQAIYQWMRLQPLESVDLPHAAQKYPIQALERTDAKGTAFAFEVTGWEALDAPLEVDASKLSIKDPERDLKTIAKEWAAEKKANSNQE